MSLSAELESARQWISGLALDYGLDFYPTIFEILDYKAVNQVAAYGGYPTRYPHWRFGMEYDHLSKSYSYGLHRIYEMVINNDPAYAYLLEGNTMVDQKMVMAHVYGHVDFFKNNFTFAHTDRKMMDQMANHATRIRRYVDKMGLERVETFIDTCLSLENLIDIHAPFVARGPMGGSKPDKIDPSRMEVATMPAKGYMKDYINPPEFIEAQRRKLVEAQEEESRFPESPVRDVLAFLLAYAPLEPWQQEVLAIIREEAYYFAPQAQTKIMNEGWATYWHAKIMTEKVLVDAEIIDFADHHSRTLGGTSTQINPYKLGYELYKDIEDRWNRGRFGKEYDDCDDMVARAGWDRQLGLGREKIFEVRRHYNDVTFIDSFLNEEFCHKHKMFMYKYNPKTGNWHIASRDFSGIKQAFLTQLTNMGQPLITVLDANHANRGELLLLHRHEGMDLKADDAGETLAALQAIWSRPVHIATVVNGKPRVLSFDGSEHSESDLDVGDTAQDGSQADDAQAG
ncbi:MAG: SpoVR family protein [Acidobacteria bacterium]|nr:SpoVR family protein [Acidobacteriota bacterium]